MKDEKPDDRLENISVPDDEDAEAEVYSLRNNGSSWSLSRRDVMAAAGASAAGAISTQSQAQAPQCGTGVAHSQPIIAIVASADGSLLFSVGSDNRLKIWKLPEGAHKQTIELAVRPICLAVNPTGSIVAIGQTGGSVRIIDLTTNSGAIYATHTGTVNALAFSPDGRLLASCGGDRNVKLLNPADGTALSTYSTGSDTPTALAFTPDSEFLIVGQSSGRTQALSSPDFVLQSLSVSQSLGVTAIAVHPDGGAFATSSLDDSVNVWSFPAGDLLLSLKHPNDVTSVIFREEQLLTTCTDFIFRTFAYPSGSLLRSTFPNQAITRIALIASVDGGRVATASSGTLRIVSLVDGRTILDCMLDLSGSPTSAQGSTYSQGGVTYTLPCGSPIPAGATCLCNCVTNCSCVSHVAAPCQCHSYSPPPPSHYWYPN